MSRPVRAVAALAVLTAVATLAWQPSGARYTAGTAAAAQTWSRAASTCASPGTQTLDAVADSYIDQALPTTTKGTASQIQVASSSAANRRGLIRFTLPAPGTGCILTAAHLNLTVGTPTAGRTVQVLTVASAWTEAAVTWNTQPATTGSPVSIVATLPNGGVESWNVLAQTQAQYAGGGYGWLIRDATENDTGGQAYYAREYPMVARRPALVLTFA
ncbi:DNRLRE domain-containing protein [Jidongwangia harbinensis]|uniref:DNRLRE domain-containing protein n=1 Tax=Jidongwangia harbinensis TaxID=2878561 RepID=UPI001CD991F1|nr:DNRLRE domain-containing protein [Jidongwangia harbinensis]MCA2218543.1 DNRLRE domain-containing protein [Jidongwangia harbinensis]